MTRITSQPQENPLSSLPPPPALALSLMGVHCGVCVVGGRSWSALSRASQSPELLSCPQGTPNVWGGLSQR